MSDDRAQLRTWFPVPADRDLPPGRHLLHRENLMSQILNEPPGSQPGSSEPPRDRRLSPRRSPAWHLSARGMVAAAAAVTLAAGLGVRAADRLLAHPAPPAPAATATVILDRIAQAAAAGPAVKVGPNQYFYVKAQVAGTSEFAKSGKVEGWIAQSQSKQTLWRNNGHSFTMQGGTTSAGFGGPVIGLAMTVPPGHMSQAKLLYPSYAYLESLPTNPRQLLNLIQRQITPVGTNDVEGFLLIGQLLSSAVLPPRTAAALYRAAALIHGVTVAPGATDALGRPGIGITYSYVGKDGLRLREEWIFSTSTYQFLGARTSVTTQGAANRDITQSTASAVLARGIADSPGGTPTLIKLTNPAGPGGMVAVAGPPTPVDDDQHDGRHFPVGSFDAVFAMNCLLHVPNHDLPAVLVAVRAVLRPDGLFFVGVSAGTRVPKARSMIRAQARKITARS